MMNRLKFLGQGVQLPFRSIIRVGKMKCKDKKAYDFYLDAGKVVSFFKGQNKIKEMGLYQKPQRADEKENKE
jgi:hypothetical protein